MGKYNKQYKPKRLMWRRGGWGFYVKTPWANKNEIAQNKKDQQNENIIATANIPCTVNISSALLIFEVARDVCYQGSIGNNPFVSVITL